MNNGALDGDDATMRIVRKPWSEVFSYDEVILPSGELALVLPRYSPGRVLIDIDGKMREIKVDPDLDVSVLEKDLGEALTAILDAFPGAQFVEEKEW